MSEKSDIDLEKKSVEKVSESVSVVYQRRSVHLKEGAADDKFDVVVPKKNIWVLGIVFLILFIAQFYYFSGQYIADLYPEEYDIADYYWWVPLVYIVLAVIPILAWGEFGSRIASSSILKWMKKTVSKKKPKTTEILLGYPMRTKDIYYLEAFPVDLDLGSEFVHTKTFLKRVMEVMFLSMGMSVVVAQMVVPFLYGDVIADNPDMYWNIEEMIIDTTIYLGPFSLLILMFVMPVFWISEDIQAYRINEHQDSVRLGFYLRNGMLSKLLGFFGIVLVFNLAQEFATALFVEENPNILTEAGSLDYTELMASTGLAIELFTTIFIWFGLIILMSAAIPFLVSLAYLSIFHEKWVNNTRIRASEFMELGTLMVRVPKSENLEYTKNPEKYDETTGFFQTKNGKILLILLIVLAAFICFYVAFILGF